MTLTARDHFTVLTQIRAGHDVSDEMVLGGCDGFAVTCTVTVPISLVAREGTLVFTAMTPLVGDGSPFSVAVENPTPHIDENLNPPFIVFTPVEQRFVFRGTGFVANWETQPPVVDPIALSYVEEVTTSTYLDSFPPSNTEIPAYVQPELLTVVRTLQFHVVNRGTGAGPPRISNTVTIDVVAAP